jgi:hypothetical protein
MTIPEAMGPIEGPRRSSDTQNVLSLMLRSQEIIQDCYLYEREAEANDNSAVAALFRELREKQSGILTHTEAAAQRLKLSMKAD